MKDLEIARIRLKDGDFSLVIVKNGKIIFETKSSGLRGFLHAIKLLDKELAKSSVADKIMGRAAALLSVYSCVTAVFAVTISEEGIKVLEDNNIPYQYENCVPNILNSRGEDLCPFEKLTMSFTNSAEAYSKLKSLIKT
jgi:hypothetical protein